ncbi:MAG: hypothetical protein ACYDBJ_20965 [Aggregatilineales bacterium]
MATVAQVRTSQTFSVKLIAVGFVAGMVMGMWQMIVEHFTGTGFWSPLVFIAATIMRDLQTVSTPVAFNLVAVVVGLMGHMMFAIVFGLVFSLAIAARIPSLMGQIVAGIVYGAVIFLVMNFIVNPAIDPVMAHLNTIAFLIGHMMFGMALGVVNYLVTRRA